MNLRDLPDMSDALKEVQAIEEKKKLDPVGKEDGDIDNDGDTDFITVGWSLRELWTNVNCPQDKLLGPDPTWQLFRISGIPVKGPQTVTNAELTAVESLILHIDSWARFL